MPDDLLTSELAPLGPRRAAPWECSVLLRAGEALQGSFRSAFQKVREIFACW